MEEQYIQAIKAIKNGGIPRRIKSLCYGVIRGAEKKFNLSALALMLWYLITAYYWICEKFIYCSSDLFISNRGAVVSIVDPFAATDSNNYARCAAVIHSKGGMVFNWGLEMAHTHSWNFSLWYSMTIEIKNADDCPKKHAYELNIMGAWIKTKTNGNENNPTWKRLAPSSDPTLIGSNRIRIWLNTINRTISVALYDEDPKVVLKNIEQSQDLWYQMTVSITNSEESIKIIDFSTDP